MRQVVVPHGEHPSRQLPIDRVPGHGGPIDVPDQRPPAWAKRSMHLSERGRYVANVLEDLNANGPVEAGIRDRERGRVSFMELDVVVPIDTFCCHGEHVRADVHADDRTFPPDYLKELADVETRAAAHVENAVPGSCAERIPHQLASAQHISRPVKPLQPLDEAPIELQLTHAETLPSRTAAWARLEPNREPPDRDPACRCGRPRTGQLA